MTNIPFRILSERQLENIKLHEYKCCEYTYIDKLLDRYFITKCAEYIPEVISNIYFKDNKSQ